MGSEKAGDVHGASDSREPPPLFHWQVESDLAVLVEVRWIPRRRSRIGISFNAGGGLRVEAPPGTTASEVRDVLRGNARWVRRQSRFARENGGVCYPAQYANGTLVLYRGKPLELRLAEGATVRLGDGQLAVPGRQTKRALWAWYARQAGAVFAAELSAAVARMDWIATPPPWRHRYMRSRWGSCNARGRIALNTHLVKLADPLIEYVIVHELCHLRHLNHGPAFQRLLRESLPDWRERRRMLHRHGDLLREPSPSESGPHASASRLPSASTRTIS